MQDVKRNSKKIPIEKGGASSEKKKKRKQPALGRKKKAKSQSKEGIAEDCPGKRERSITVYRTQKR